MYRCADTEQIAENIRRLRKTRRMTQQELADKMGINRITIARWETGKYQPQDINVLADALNADPSEIILVRDAPDNSRIAQTKRYTDRKQIAENIFRIRHVNGLTQNDVATKMGVSRTLITAYENGSVYPPNIKALADALGCDLSELILSKSMDSNMYDSLADDLRDMIMVTDPSGGGTVKTDPDADPLDDGQRQILVSILKTCMDFVTYSSSQRKTS